MILSEVTRVAVIPRDAHNLNMNISMAGSRLFQSDDLTIVIGDGRRRRNVQENLASRKRDLTIVQGAAFRVQRRGNNTYFIQADGTAFEDVVVLVRDKPLIFYSHESNFLYRLP